MKQFDSPSPEAEAPQQGQGPIETKRRWPRLLAGAAVTTGLGLLAASFIMDGDEGPLDCEASQVGAAPIEGDAEWGFKPTALMFTGDVRVQGEMVKGDPDAEYLDLEDTPTAVVMTVDKSLYSDVEYAAIIYDNGGDNDPSPEAGILPVDELQTNPCNPDELIVAVHQGDDNTWYGLGTVRRDHDGSFKQITTQYTDIASMDASDVASHQIVFR